MANNCWQHIELEGPSEDIERFMDQAQEYLALDTEEQRKAWHAKGNVFTLAEKHWFDCVFEETTIESTVKWAPSESDFTELAALFPTLRIKVEYEECGNDIAGSMLFDEGEMEGETTYPCPSNSLQENFADLIMATVLSPADKLTEIIALPEGMTFEDEDYGQEVDVDEIRKAARWALEGNSVMVGGKLSREKATELAEYMQLRLLPEGVDGRDQCVGAMSDLLKYWERCAEPANLANSFESLYRQLFEETED